MSINYVDMAVLAVLLFFVIVGYFKGFIKMCFSFLPQLAAVLCSRLLSPVASSFLRLTPLFEMLKKGVKSTLGIDEALKNVAADTQRSIIEGLDVPSFLKQALLENNNPVVYKILNVEEVGDYISGFIANVCINILSLIIIFVLVYIVFKLMLSALDVVSKLPVIDFFNSGGGAIVGAVFGVFVIWLAMLMVFLLYSNPKMSFIVTAMENSRVAVVLYENNLLLKILLKIFV